LTTSAGIKNFAEFIGIGFSKRNSRGKPLKYKPFAGFQLRMTRRIRLDRKHLRGHWPFYNGDIIRATVSGNHRLTGQGGASNRFNDFGLNARPAGFFVLGHVNTVSKNPKGLDTGNFKKGFCQRVRFGGLGVRVSPACSWWDEIVIEGKGYVIGVARCRYFNVFGHDLFSKD
jgi:hypothetical protein